MLRALRRVLLAILLLVPATLARAGGIVPNGYQVTGDAPLYQGVEHLTLTDNNPAESVHVARVAAGAPVALRAVSAYDAIPHRTADQELPSDMCRRTACIAGINGDFHNLDTDQPYGGVVAAGRMLRSPQPGWDQVTLSHDGTLHAGALGWSGALTAADGSAVPLTGVNVDRGADDVVLYTPAWGASTPSGAETEIVVRAAGPIGGLGATAVQIVGTRHSSGAIPADGAVLSGVGPSGAALRAIADGVAGGGVGRSAQLQLHTATDAVESLGVNPVILRDGQRVYPAVVNGFTSSRNPRTLLGWNHAGEVMLVTVDGRRDDADGMTLAQAADLLLGLGATDAVNFDGGGGTTFVVNGGQVANLPSDPGDPGPPAYPDGHVVAPGHVERLAPNALVLVAKPADPPPPPPPAESTTTSTAPPADPGSGSGGGSTDPTAGGDVILTGGDVRDLIGSIGDDPASGDPSGLDPGFVVGGVGSSSRLLMPAPDKGHVRTKSGKGKGRNDTAATGDVSGDWLAGLTSPSGSAGGSGGDHQSALPLGGDESGDPPLNLALSLTGVVATGLILAVLDGIMRVRRNRRRARPALWL